MDLLSLMHEAEPYGHLLVNGAVPSAADLAQIFSGKRSEIAKLLAELSEKGVPSVDENGVWFSRRMVRDHKRKIINQKNGRNGGNPSLSGQSAPAGRISEPDNRLGYPTGISEPRRVRITGSDKPRARVPEARSQKLEASLAASYDPDADPRPASEATAASDPPPASGAPAARTWDDVVAEVVEIGGLDPTALISAEGTKVDWSKEKFSPELDILPVVRAKAGKPGYRPPRGVGWFTAAIREHHERRTLAAVPSAASPPPVSVPSDEERWNTILDTWEASGRKVWVPIQWGQPPVDRKGRYDPHCRIPKSLLIRRGIIPADFEETAS